MKGGEENKKGLGIRMYFQKQGLVTIYEKHFNGSRGGEKSLK